MGWQVISQYRSIDLSQILHLKIITELVNRHKSQ
jgi:hypothetical protein